MTATTVFTSTVAPSGTLISLSMPATGAGISASTLSVEISKSGSSFSTLSPAFLSHLVMVPSKIDSPNWGITISIAPATGVAICGAADFASDAGAGVVAMAAGPEALAPSITATTVFTSTVAPSGTLISLSTPATGEGISASTLSVEISKSGSSFSTLSPAFLSHFVMVPSKIDSPIWGIITSVAMNRSLRVAGL